MTVDLVSFDGTEACRAPVVAPDRHRTLRDVLAGPGPFAARGAGLSYCQASAAEGTTVVPSRHFDRFLQFDASSLQVTVEAGVTVGDLVRFAVAHRAHVPVLPGHPAITVGGCIGFNVHGKSQHDAGCFSDHVTALRLLHPDHGEVECSRADHADVFDLTLGGMGLTGFVTSATLQLVPLPGPAVRRVAHPVGGLVEAAETMAALDASGEDGRTLYSWHDLTPRRGGFGRGFVYAERFADEPAAARSSYRSLTPRPRRGPGVAANRAVTRTVNRGYAARERLRPRRLLAVEDAAFPINGSEAYYRLFGRRGFREYQLVVPAASWGSAAGEIRRLVADAGVPVTLGSLKLFRGDRHLLWFRDDGICLAVDVAEGEGARGLFARLDRLALDHGGLVNLSKDSRLGAATVRALYPGYDEFRRRLGDYDPKRRFESMLRRRIDV